MARITIAPICSRCKHKMARTGIHTVHVLDEEIREGLYQCINTECNNYRTYDLKGNDINPLKEDNG